MKWIHLFVALALLVSHSLFIFFGRRFYQGGPRPGPWANRFRAFSQLGLPLVLLTGFLSLITGGEMSSLKIIHIFIGIAPVLAIFILIFARSFKKRHPFFLPLLNGGLLLLAFLTGLFSLWR